MRLGVHLARYDAPPAGMPALLADLGRAADEAGVDVLTAPDHLFQVPYVGGVHDPVLEGYTALAFLAAHTRTVDLGLLVSGVTYRSPALLAKTVATLDVLSGGRAVLGLGASWYEQEHRALGLPFPPLRDRFEVLEDTVRVVRQLWSADDGPFEGNRLRLAATVSAPAPVHPVPVLVAGVGERTLLRLVARHADACHLFAGGDSGPEFVAGRLATLDEHCAAEGRDPAALRRTIRWTPPVDPDRPEPFLEAMRAMAGVGVDEVHVTADVRPVDLVRALGDRVVPGLRML